MASTPTEQVHTMPTDTEIDIYQTLAPNTAPNAPRTFTVVLPQLVAKSNRLSTIIAGVLRLPADPVPSALQYLSNPTKNLDHVGFKGVKEAELKFVVKTIKDAGTAFRHALTTTQNANKILSDALKPPVIEETQAFEVYKFLQAMGTNVQEGIEPPFNKPVYVIKFPTGFKPTNDEIASVVTTMRRDLEHLKEAVPVANNELKDHVIFRINDGYSMSDGLRNKIMMALRRFATLAADSGQPTKGGNPQVTRSGIPGASTLINTSRDTKSSPSR